MRKKLYDLDSTNSTYYDTAITTCDYCNNKATYYLVAKSTLYPYFGVSKTRLLCKKHHNMWVTRNLVL
jgi:hypothetical protein